MSSTTRLVGLVLIASACLAAPARGQVRESLTVDEAAIVFQEVATIPEAGIPVSLLQGAEGFAIIPSVIKAGFIVGGRFGRGVVVVRGAEGGWSNPIFVTLAGGGVGFQAGAQATDLILVFRSRKSIESFLRGRGQFTLGADAAVAAGPVGRQAGAGTDVTLRAEILSYSRSRGLFAGVSLEGASLKIDWKANVAYYGQVLPTGAILAEPDLPAPESAARLRAVVTQLSTPIVVVPAQPGVTGPGLEPIPAEGAPLPAVDGATTRLQSAEPSAPRRVIVSTPTGTPGRVVYAAPPRVIVSTPAPRVIATAPGAPPVIVSTPAAPRGTVQRSTPQPAYRPGAAVGWKRAEDGTTRLR